MTYENYKTIWRNRNKHLIGYNSANGTTTDQTTDPVITRDPNDYLVPRVDSIISTGTLMKIALVMAIIVLIPIVLKTVKSF